MKSTFVRVLTGASAFLAVAAGAAYATGSDTPQTIQACQEKNGTLRVVATDADCKQGETPLSWNTQGPQGPPGPAGGMPAEHTQVVGRASVEGIAGGNPFSVRGFSWGASNSGDAGAGGGGGAGKATVGDVELVRSVDALSAPLVDDAATGRHLRSATVELFVPGTQTAYARYSLSDVRVSQVRHDGNLETFRLNAATIEEQSLGAGPQLAQGSELGTLELDGLAGQLAVSDDGFRIDSSSSQSGGGAGNTATYAPLVVRLAHGAASPQLVEDVLTGKHLKTATVTTPHATYSLTDVVVRSVQDEATGAAGSVPSEEIELTAADVAVTSS